MTTTKGTHHETYRPESCRVRNVGRFQCTGVRFGLDRLPAWRSATKYDDPRQIEKKMHREYDSTKRQPNIFMLNGRSFPFTLRDTLIQVKPNERVKLRILNAGARTIALHTHGRNIRLRLILR